MITRFSSIALQNPIFLICALITSLTFVQGCAEYQVRIPSEHVPDDYKGQTMKAWWWGNWNDPEVLAAECGTEGINDVVIKRKYYHDLASVFSLGIIMPIEVTFRCESQDIQPATID